MFVGNTNVLEMLSHWKQLKLLLDMGTWKHLVSLIQAFYAEQTATMRSKDLSTAFSFSTARVRDKGATYPQSNSTWLHKILGEGHLKIVNKVSTWVAYWSTTYATQMTSLCEEFM